MKGNWRAFVALWTLVVGFLSGAALFWEDGLWWTLVGISCSGILYVCLFLYETGTEEKSQREWPKSFSIEPAPKGAPSNGGITMRAIGYIFAPIAIITSLLAPLVIATLLVVPAAHTTPMPVFGGSVYGFVHDMLPFYLLLWQGSNFLSGRWPVQALQKSDLYSSRWAFWGIAAVAAWIGLAGDYAAIDRDLGIVLFASLAMAYLDLWHMKSLAFMASSMKGDMARLISENQQLKADLGAARAQLAQLMPNAPIATAGPGPFLAYVNVLGVSNLNPFRVPLNPPDQAYLVLLSDGSTDLDADLSQARLEQIFAAEVAKRKSAP